MALQWPRYVLQYMVICFYVRFQRIDIMKQKFEAENNSVLFKTILCPLKILYNTFFLAGYYLFVKGYRLATKSLCFYFLKITWLIIIYVILKGAEKKNDYLCRYFHCKINRWDAATNLLFVEKQRGVLRERERERAKYPYTKTRLSYWVEGGKETSARKVQRVSTSPQLHTESA